LAFAVTTDIESNPRNATTPDIGAYEFNGTIDPTDMSPLAGIYTIDNTLSMQNRNYNSFQAAIDELVERGMSDTVVFQVTAGQVHSPASTTTDNCLILTRLGSETKPISFVKSGSGANPLLQFAGTGYNEAAFYIENSTYLTFDGLDIEDVGTNARYVEWGFYLGNSSHITITNCNIRMRNASGCYGIYLYAANSHHYFKNNNITQVERGYYFYGMDEDNHIEGGVIDSVSYGVSLRNLQPNIIIEKLKIFGYNNSGYGIDLYTGNNQRIINNVVAGFASSIRKSSSNMEDTLYLAHNTIYNLPASGQYTYCFDYNATYGKVILQNNIMINKSTANASCIFLYNINHILSGSNNNLYGMGAGNVLYLYPSTYVKNVNSYKELLDNGAESNSVQWDVQFESVVPPYNLNVKTDIPTKAESGRQVITRFAVITDIDDNPHHATTPDIGAYEFIDTVDTTDISPLAGVYTIDNTLPTEKRNFNSFKEAIETLNFRGASDTVIFEVMSEQIHLIKIKSFLFCI
jgi:hypothetical protein